METITAIQARREDELFNAGLETYDNESFWGNSFWSHYLDSIELVLWKYDFFEREWKEQYPMVCEM